MYSLQIPVDAFFQVVENLLKESVITRNSQVMVQCIEVPEGGIDAAIIAFLKRLTWKREAVGQHAISEAMGKFVEDAPGVIVALSHKCQARQCNQCITRALFQAIVIGKQDGNAFWLDREYTMISSILPGGKPVVCEEAISCLEQLAQVVFPPLVRIGGRSKGEYTQMMRLSCFSTFAEVALRLQGIANKLLLPLDLLLISVM